MKKEPKLICYFIELFDGDISIYGSSIMATNRNIALNIFVNKIPSDEDLIKIINKTTRMEISIL